MPHTSRIFHFGGKGGVVDGVTEVDPFTVPLLFVVQT
jgi:hypothetical protein